MGKSQQEISKNKGYILDGRDIGTHVLPNAQLKIFLTASADVRAKRRYDELTAKGTVCDYEVIKQDIIKRDHQDMTRATAPLKQAEDAVLVDSSDMTIDQVVEAIIAEYHKISGK